MEYTTIGIVEFYSIPSGIEGLDAMVKKSPVRIIDAATVCPGKYYIVITGEVAEVEAAMVAGMETREETVVDHLFIPNLHRQVVPALLGKGKGKTEKPLLEAAGIFEAPSITGSVMAGDIAVKAADVSLIEIRLGKEIGGKSFFSIAGRLEDVDEAMRQAAGYGSEAGLVCNHTVIPRFHEETWPYIIDTGPGHGVPRLEGKK